MLAVGFFLGGVRIAKFGINLKQLKRFGSC